jgi:hypothetical protein
MVHARIFFFLKFIFIFILKITCNGFYYYYYYYYYSLGICGRSFTMERDFWAHHYNLWVPLIFSPLWSSLVCEEKRLDFWPCSHTLDFSDFFLLLYLNRRISFENSRAPHFPWIFARTRFSFCLNFFVLFDGSRLAFAELSRLESNHGVPPIGNNLLAPCYRSKSQKLMVAKGAIQARWVCCRSLNN